MHNRSAKLLFVAGAGAIASFAVAATVPSPAHADTCLAAPNAPTPAGSHWFYRLDHSANRKCWYLRKVDAAPIASAPSDTSPAGSSDAPASEVAVTPSPSKPTTTAESSQSAPSTLRSSVADARAEYAAPSQRRDPAPAAASSPFPDPAMSTPAEATQQVAAPSAQGAPVPPTPTMNERWSDPTTATAAPASAETADKLRKAAKVAAKSTPAASSATSMSASTIATLIGALLAALAVAGGIVAALVKFGRSEPIVRRDPTERPDLWAGRTEQAVADMYADDFRSSPIDLDASAAAATVNPQQRQNATWQEENDPPAWIKVARERHVANDSIRTDDVPARQPARGEPQANRVGEKTRDSETAREPAPAADEIEQLLALAQKRSAA
ncbi:hypothetical protein DY468_02795 [Rhodopseudomonas sp. BR0M22]|nr:hypothetical protein [Rhodopseudomonas sp. BR0M22]